MSKIHSKIGASSADRWMNCPGSVRLCLMSPEQESSGAAREGTCAHTILQLCLENGHDAKQYVNSIINDITVTDEMASAVQVAIDWVYEKRQQVGGVLSVETTFRLGHLYDGLFGTNDILINKPGKILVVADYKHGQGIVDVKENKQLLYYALGAAEHVDWNFQELELVIIQPRAPHSQGPIRSWSINKEYLASWSKLLIEAAAETEKPNAPLYRGDWCGYCPAKGLCPKMKELTEDTLAVSVSESVATLPTISSLSDAQVSKIIENTKLIEDFLAEVKRSALSRLQAGEKIPGLKLVAGRGRRVWGDEAKAEMFLTEKLSDKAFKRELLSVAQAEKLVPKAELESLWVDIAGSETVAPESDKRRAIEPLGGELKLNKNKGVS